MPAPADLTFRRESLAVVRRQCRRPRRNVSAIRSVLPSGSFDHSAGPHAESIRTTPYFRMPMSRSFFPIAHALRTCVRSFCGPRRSPSPIPLLWAATRGHQGSHHEPSRCDLVGSRFKSSSVESMLVCGSKRKRSTPSNRDAVDRGLRRQIEHRVQIDRRFGARAALADETGPHRVVQRRPSVLRTIVHRSLHSPFAQRFGVRVSGAEVFQDDEGICRARFSM